MNSLTGRLGDLLLEKRRISPEQLGQALSRQETHGHKLGHNIVEMGFAEPDSIVALLSLQFGVPSINLSRFALDPAVVRLIKADTARKHQIVPISRAGPALTVAMSDPANVFAIDDVKFMTGCHVEPVVASETAILEAIEKYYPAEPTPPGGREAGGHAAAGRPSVLEMASRGLQALQATPDDAGLVEVVDEPEEISLQALAGTGDAAPVVRLVHVVLMSAVQQGASDIHIEPYETELRIRYRIDGLLHHIMSPPMKYREAICSRVKIMARLDIAEKRLPQDGRIKIRFNDDGAPRQVEFRVSVLPTLHGEKIAMRLLDRRSLMLELERLGFEAESLARFESAIQRPWGMVLVTGPTGSGKTSTLYSCIARLNTPDTNIMTAEDPVEFNLPGVNQLQVRDNIGLTFAAALRSFLRQDPNVILLGEIRDVETAGIAVKAALTGHLVLSTLHTNDAPGTIDRLTNMGVERFLVASSLHQICAQRLVRRICPHCVRQNPHSTAALVQAGYTAAEAPHVRPMKGAGCGKCNHTGYKGRVGLFEVMDVTDGVREQILAGAATSELRRRAIEEGMITLRASGLHKVKNGVTTMDEVMRETAV